MTTKRKPQRWGTEKKWFSASEAARYLGVSVDKVRQLDESRELPAERTKGGHRRFSRKALDAYLADRSGEAASALDSTFGALPRLDVPNRNEWNRG